jgi:hypothetical protein
MWDGCDVSRKFKKVRYGGEEFKAVKPLPRRQKSAGRHRIADSAGMWEELPPAVPFNRTSIILILLHLCPIP